MCSRTPPPWRRAAPCVRAAQLAELGDARQALMRLAALLAEAGRRGPRRPRGAAADEGTYWRGCMEAIDAADVLEMLRSSPTATRR
ncbi:hypothetical protein SFUMM280S_09974 [Streptomyces fumanus]